MNELNLIIIWEKGRVAEKEIIADVCANFSVCEIIDMQWDKELFHNNLTRFYGQKLPSGSHKEKHCGNGRFILITFIDSSPVYDFRDTSRGPEFVNTNVFDKKSLYRNWTGGGHKVHTTNGNHETSHDLMLLLGKDVDSYIIDFLGVNKDLNHEHKRLDKNIEGTGGWTDFEHLFKVLNQCNNYVVMRNFENLPGNYQVNEHGDIDFLTDCAKEFSYILNANKSRTPFRPAAYFINVGGEFVPCDIREIGDGYYDKNWQKNILENSIMYNDFKVPCSNDLMPMLAYHALVHKTSVSIDYLNTFKKNGLNLNLCKVMVSDFLIKNDYQVDTPKDLSVYFNANGVKSLNVELKSYNKIHSFVRLVRQVFLVDFRIYLGKILKG